MSHVLRLALGIGCDRGTPAATIGQAVDAALADLSAHCGASAFSVGAAASIDLKAGEAGLLELAAARGWPLTFYPAAQLAAVAVPNPSATVLRHTDTPSVSEAAALLAAGSGDGVPAPMTALLIEKFRLRGSDGRNATVSIARIA